MLSGCANFAISAESLSSAGPTALESVDRVYLITEVVYSAGVELVVTAGGCTKQYCSNRVLPLAFLYQKFPLYDDGTVGTEVSAALSFGQ